MGFKKLGLGRWDTLHHDLDWDMGKRVIQFMCLNHIHCFSKKTMGNRKRKKSMGAKKYPWNFGIQMCVSYMPSFDHDNSPYNYAVPNIQDEIQRWYSVYSILWTMWRYPARLYRPICVKVCLFKCFQDMQTCCCK